MPYSVVFGHLPVLPVDMLFANSNTSVSENSATPRQYIKDVGASLTQIWDTVRSHLEVNKKEILSQYNKGIAIIKQVQRCGSKLTSSTVLHSDFSLSDGSDSDSDNGSGDLQPPPDGGPRYPRRERAQRVIPGAIPWCAVRL